MQITKEQQAGAGGTCPTVRVKDKNGDFVLVNEHEVAASGGTKSGAPKIGEHSTKAEIMAELERRDVEFNASLTKVELLDLLQEESGE